MRWIVPFLLIAFGLAYAIGFSYFPAGQSLASPGSFAPTFLLIGVAYMYTPAIAAVIAQRIFAA